jgi:hypothetical protein
VGDGDLDELYPDSDVALLAPELRDLLPRHKDDRPRVERLVELGYPRNREALPHLAVWLQDANWPVAGPIASYFVELGWAVVPVVRKALASGDVSWAYWMLDLVVSGFDSDIVAELRDDIEPWTRSEDDDVAEAACRQLERV